MKLNNYTFEDVWTVRATPDDFYTVFKDVANWPDWWAGLKRVEILQFNEDITGSRAAMTWKAPIGYDLKFEITITDYVDGEGLAFEVDGDISGAGSWDLVHDKPCLKLKMVLEAQTTKSWMNRLAPILRPVFIAAHNALMHRGEKGLAKRLRSTTGPQLNKRSQTDDVLPKA